MYCLYCLAVWSLHYLAAALTPLHSYPCSGWKMQQLVSCSEPWCSAGGKGYQTVGILARLTRLCTLRLSVKTQLCLLSFHIPKQTEEAIVSKRNQNLVNIRHVFIYSVLKVVLKREVLKKIHHSEMNHRNFMVLVKCCCLETQVEICHWRTTKNSSSDISFGMRSWRQHLCMGRFINFKITGSQVDLAAMGFLTARRGFSVMT